MLPFKDCTVTNLLISLICRLAEAHIGQDAVPFQWDCADQCAASSVGDRVCFGSHQQWLGSLDLLLPYEALEEQHRAPLQPGNGWLSAQHGFAFPRQLLRLRAQVDVWTPLLQHLPLHVGNESHWKYLLLGSHSCRQVHACGASTSSHQLAECLQSHDWSAWNMGTHNLNDCPYFHFKTWKRILLWKLHD